MSEKTPREFSDEEKAKITEDIEKSGLSPWEYFLSTQTKRKVPISIETVFRISKIFRNLSSY
jgi:hypothetical protein